MPEATSYSEREHEAVMRDGMLYHVKLELKNHTVARGSRSLFKFDLSEAQLTKQFVEPYREGRAIYVAGKPNRLENLISIEIRRSTENSQQTAARLRVEYEAEMERLSKEQRSKKRNGIAAAFSPAEKGLIFHSGVDVTDEYITAPPGERNGTPTKLTSPDDKSTVDESPKVGNDVFIVTWSRRPSPITS